MGTSYQHLVDEIDRQLSNSESATKEETQHSPIIIDAQQQFNSQCYRDSLLRLRSSIASYLKSETEHNAHLDLRDKSLIWQIPAFCANGAVINQEFSKDRNKALQELRSAKHDVTDDIWGTKDLVEWESSTESSVVLVQGTSQSLERLEKFSVEMVDHLASASAHPILYLLNPLLEAVYKRSVFRGNDVLRQLAVQCLQVLGQTAMPSTVDLLADMTCKFQDEKSNDWFSILEVILSHQRQVSIVLNAGVLGGHFQDACSWPTGFSRLVQRLQGKTLLKVMIITCRRINAEIDATTRVMVVGNDPRVPSHLNRLPPHRPCSATPRKLSNADALDRDKRTSSDRKDCPIDSTSIQQSTLPDAADAANCHLATTTDSHEQDSIENGHDKSPMVLHSPHHGTKSQVENMRSTELGAIQAASLGSCEASAAQWFKNLAVTHEVMYGQKGHDLDSYKPVKVAVLDTGFAYTAAEDKKVLKPYYHHIKKLSNFIDGDTDAEAKTDPSGHGTAVAVQLLKVSLRAALYICRVVSQGADGLFPDKSAVERAVRKAAAKPDKEKPGMGGWGVDIIIMSFGWPFDDHEGVSEAIRFARLNGVHMFAATSNDGLLGPPNDILYPARSRDVIAVDAADGLGEYARTTASSLSPHGRERRFSAPGLGLLSPNSATTWSGSSFACPIAAGIGALILEFARQPPLNKSQTVQDRLKDMPAMIAILRRMSSEKGPDRFKFLLPWELIGQVDEPREFTCYSIVKELRKEFGPGVGSEISDYFKTSLHDLCL